MHEHSSSQPDPVVAAVGVEFDENDVPSPSSKQEAADSPLAEAVHSAWSSENLPTQFLSTLGLWNKERVKELTDR
jgi:hypothetical protein